uniref:DNA-directed RNA polymerase subunit alpha n=1 Tax=Passiflora jatunsachensis TaxID=1341363 RepID=A0A4Y5QDX0_9ROSI|nr:RNA polymerase alpha subunit [Passiflora jatunsachensis]YP_009670487.1 RNA polymerase alpha subunit [Passiflora jatunsachensis]QCX29721.1 RNA polymerase alpha subunit [Passiflora jatunsachensis]QCX29722.1 RNA polymerase alpha subunit [Passiflora jatunsachensis]
MNLDDKKIYNQEPHWKCLESRVDSKRLYYGRFLISPLKKGEAQTIGFMMRRILLGELEGASITRAKFDKKLHEFSTIEGIQESVHEILMNLKEIVFKPHFHGTLDAYICVKGPGNVTAQHIISPTPLLEIVDNTQHIANLRKPIDLRIELQIEKNRGYCRKPTKNFQDGSFSIDAVCMPVRNMNFSIYSLGSQKDMLFLEIWTNGSLTPKEALHEACRTLINFFIPFLVDLEDKNLDLEELDLEEKNLDLEELDLEELDLEELDLEEKNLDLEDKSNPNSLECIFIDQLNLNPRVYNCLKRYNINTVWDLLCTSDKELRKMEGFVIGDLAHITRILEDILKTLGIDID